MISSQAVFHAGAGFERRVFRPATKTGHHGCAFGSISELERDRFGAMLTAARSITDPRPAAGRWFRLPWRSRHPDCRKEQREWIAQPIYQESCQWQGPHVAGRRRDPRTVSSSERFFAGASTSLNKTWSWTPARHKMAVFSVYSGCGTGNTAVGSGCAAAGDASEIGNSSVRWLSCADRKMKVEYAFSIVVRHLVDR